MRGPQNKKNHHPHPASRPPRQNHVSPPRLLGHSAKKVDPRLKGVPTVDGHSRRVRFLLKHSSNGPGKGPLHPTVDRPMAQKKTGAARVTRGSFEYWGPVPIDETPFLKLAHDRKVTSSQKSAHFLGGTRVEGTRYGWFLAYRHSPPSTQLLLRAGQQLVPIGRRRSNNCARRDLGVFFRRRIPRPPRHWKSHSWATALTSYLVFRLCGR